MMILKIPKDRTKNLIQVFFPKHKLIKKNLLKIKTKLKDHQPNLNQLEDQKKN